MSAARTVQSQSPEFVAPAAHAKPVPAGSMGDEIPALLSHSQPQSSPCIGANDSRGIPLPASGVTLHHGANP